MSVVLGKRFGSAESRDSTCAVGANKQTKQECPVGEVRLTQLSPRLSCIPGMVQRSGRMVPFPSHKLPAKPRASHEIACFLQRKLGSSTHLKGDSYEAHS